MAQANLPRRLLIAGLTLLSGCARAPAPAPIATAEPRAADTPRADTAREPVPGVAAAPPRTQGLWGVHLGEPVRATPLRVRSCESGRAFAHPQGRYDIVSDDVLFSVPHEHGDSSAVLAALDSARACFATLPASGALALVTLVRDSITHATLVWPDSARPMAYDSLVAAISAVHGPPVVNQHGVPIWYGDSSKIVVNRRGPLGPRSHAFIGDARACAWFERLVHRAAPAPNYVEAGARSCWVPPDTGSGRREP